MYYNTYSTEESINNKVRYQYITSVDYEKDNSRNLTYPMLLHQKLHSNILLTSRTK